MFVVLDDKHALRMRNIFMLPARLYDNFTHFLINDIIFEKKLLSTKYVF